MSIIEPITNFVVKSPTGQTFDISPLITRASFSYSLTTGASVSVTVEDFDLSLLQNNYFQLNQEFLIDGKLFLLSSVEIGEGDYAGARVTIELLERAFQKMKRDYSPEVYKSSNGYEYAKKVASKYKLNFVGEQVRGKQQTIKVKAKNNRESTWAVLQRAASDNQYMCFIADNTLFFASPKYLLGQWGIDSVVSGAKTIRYVPLFYNNRNTENRFFLMSIPEMRRSVDSPKEGEGSAKVWGPNANQLRAGMTVAIRGVGGGFNGEYLVTSVAYDMSSPEPVSIAFATTAKLAPADKAKLDEKIGEVTVISGGTAS